MTWPVLFAAFEVAALVDSLDFAGHYDIETATGTVQVLERVLSTHPTCIYWRDKGGARVRYASKEEYSPYEDDPLEKRRVVRQGMYGYLRQARATPDVFGLVRGECSRRGLVFGIHTTYEENHRLSWSESNWNLAHPQFTCRTRSGEPCLSTCSLSYPEVMRHKLALVDERLALKPEVILLDMCRAGAWGVHREYVRPVCERWRARYNCDPPADSGDERWISLVAEDVSAYLRAFSERCHRAGVKFQLGVRAVEKEGDTMWRQYGIDWRRLAREGVFDDIVVMGVRPDRTRPFESTEEILRWARAECAPAGVWFNVSMYSMNYGVPMYCSWTKLSAGVVAERMLESARRAGCSGVVLECVDFKNYPPDVCEALSKANENERQRK